MSETLLISIGLPLACCLTFSFALELLLIPRPVWPWQRPVISVLLHKGICLLLFASLLLLLQRPWFCCISILALQVMVVMISNAKYHSLREPFIYQDFSYFIDALRFPRLYLPFLGIGRALVAVVAFFAAIYAGLILEQPLRVAYSFQQISALAMVLIGIGLVLLLLGSSVRHRLTLEPVTDLQQLGLFASLWCYFRAEQHPWQGEGVACFQQNLLQPGPGEQRPNMVVIQSESFFDPRRWNRSIMPDLLPHFDRLKQESLQHGTLTVPAWGANTVRTEAAFLTGIPNQQLGIHRFKPYRRFARQRLATLVSYLKKQGYRTVCLHPYASGFYDRATVFPGLGFDQFIDITRFSAVDYHGQYVGDTAVAREIYVELAGHDTPGSKPLFLFVITMENHGPLHLEKPQPEDRQRFFTASLPEGCDDLTVYLHHLEQADLLLGKVREQLAAMQHEGLLCLYGDHLPIMPQVYQTLGEPDGTVDYLVWSNKKQMDGVAAQMLAVEQLAAVLLKKAGLGAVSQSGNSL